MPMQKGAAPFSFDQALKQNANNEVEWSQDFTPLPADVSGVARLVELKLGKFKSGANKGKRFIHMAGVVVKPKTAVEVVKEWDATLNGGKGGEKTVINREVEIEGRRTSQNLCLEETKDSKGNVTPASENVARFVNELLMLGGDTSELAETGEAGLPGFLEALKEAGPFFRFSTSASDVSKDRPKMRVWENWHGIKGLENFSMNGQAAAVGAVEDHTEAEAPTEEDQEASEAGDEPASDEEMTPAEMAAKCDEDPEAKDESLEPLRDALKSAALEAGLTEEQVAEAPNWAEIVEMTEAAGVETGEEGGEDQEQEEPESPAEPEVRSVYKIKVIDPKTKKPAIDPKTKKARKPVECKVTAVDGKNQTVTLVDLSNPKTTFKGIKWTALLDPESGEPAFPSE